VKTPPADSPLAVTDVRALLALTARAEADHFWFRGFRGFVAPVIAGLARGRRDLRLVDCGCGTGQNLTLLGSYGRAFGFDLTEGSGQRARAIGLPVARGDVTRAPIQSDTADLATCFDVLQCVHDDAAAVSEMRRIVRPGGAVVLTLAALEILRGDHAEVWGEVRRYTNRSARRLMEQAGLDVERVSYLYASVFPLVLATRTAQRLLRPFRRPRADADIPVPPAPINLALTAVVSAEAWLSRRVPMPVGSSLLVVARKRTQ
jgi:SAM-dependent methyltransferase